APDNGVAMNWTLFNSAFGTGIAVAAVTYFTSQALVNHWRDNDQKSVNTTLGDLLRESRCEVAGEAIQTNLRKVHLRLAPEVDRVILMSILRTLLFGWWTAAMLCIGIALFVHSGVSSAVGPAPATQASTSPCEA